VSALLCAGDGTTNYAWVDLLASPSWKGKMPPGITRVVRGESDLLGTLTRTQVIGGEKDLPRVKQIQQSYKLQPLSKFLGIPAPADVVGGRRDRKHEGLGCT
jgi:hypothetical protein